MKTSHKILYIEPDNNQKKSLVANLSDKGYEVIETNSGNHGLKLVEENVLDAIICDLNMQEYNGIEILEKIRQKNSSIPFIFISSRGTIPLAVEAMQKGADHFFTTPVEADSIVKSIIQSVEKNKSQKNINHSHEMLQNLSDTLPDIIYSLDPEGIIINLNQAVKTILDYDSSDLLGKPVFTIIHPDDREHVMNIFKHSIQEKDTGVNSIQFRIRSKNGEYKPFEVNRRHVFKKNKIIRSDGIARDISQRIELERQLKTSSENLKNKAKELEKKTILLGKANLELLKIQEQMELKNYQMSELLKEHSQKKDELQAILDSNPNVIIAVNSDNTITEANRSVEFFFDVTVDEILNKNFNIFLNKIKNCFEDFDYFQKISQQLHFDSTKVKKMDYDPVQLFSLAVKQIKPVERMLLPVNITLLNDMKQPIGKLWIFNDITAIKKADDQLRTIVNASPIPIIVSRLSDGKILFVNNHLASLIGYDKDNLMNKKTPDFYYNASDRDKILLKLRKEGSIQNYEVQIKKSDGTPLWVLLSIEKTNIADDEVTISGLYNIDKRKQAEHKIATRLRYEEGLAACSQILLTQSETQNVLSKALELLLHASNSCRVYIFENFKEKTGELYIRLTYEVCAPGIQPHINDPQYHHLSYQAGFKRWQETLSKGKHIKGLINLFPQTERNMLETQNIKSILVLPLWVEGNWYGFIGFEDVKQAREWNDEDTRLLQTAAELIGIYLERKRFEEALRISEERFRNLVENANDIIYSLNPDGTLSYISPKFSNLLGYDSSDFLGKPFFPLIHPEDAQKSQDWFQTKMKQATKPETFHFRMQHKNGSIRYFITNSSVMRDENENVLEIIGVAHDITHMKNILNDLEKANQHLRETHAQLFQSEKMASLGMLVAGIAHEINTPIGAVNSMQDTLFRTLSKLKTIIQDNFPEECNNLPSVQSAFNLIENSNKVIKSGTERVINIVKRLRSFARLDEDELNTVDIHEGLEDTLTLIYHEIKHNIKIIRNYGQIPLVSCFPGQINQVFLNILINAKQAIKNKGTIEIKTYSRNNNVYIDINDNGIGIPSENLSKIFDPGFTTKGVGVGTGLGLSICYKIIQRHHGNIEVNSTTGKGTTFTIILPVEQNS